MFRTLFSMSSWLMLLFLLFASKFMAQDSLRNTQFKLFVEINSYGFPFEPYYQGSDLLIGITLNKNPRNQLGVSTGLFHVTVPKGKYDSYKMRYYYIPLYLTRKKFLRKGNDFIDTKIGFILQSYFDTDLFISSGIPFINGLWISHNGAIDLDNHLRSRRWFIISNSYGYQFRNRLSLSVGISLHFFRASNLPEVYQLQKDAKNAHIAAASFFQFGLQYRF